MEKNTILLDLKEYDKLRDFKKNIEQNKTLKVHYCYNDNYKEIYNWTILTTEEAIKEILKDNKTLKEALEHKKDIDLEDVKKMSIWKFLKWRKSFSNVI
jgi:hypothetical protein